mgnify:CR=1 FL=1
MDPISNITFLTTFTTVLGLLIFLSGFYCLHHVSNKDILKKRIGSVALAMFGFCIMWGAVAMTAPLAVDQQSKIMKVGGEWIIAEASYLKIRDCKIGSFKAILSDNLIEVEIPTPHMNTKNVGGGREISTIYIDNFMKFSPSKLYLQATHVCPFSIRIMTSFPIIEIPKGYIDNYVP